MIRTVLARLRGSAAILPHKLDERLQAYAALVNGGLDVANLAPGVRFPAAQFAEGKTISFLTTPRRGRAQDPNETPGVLSYDHFGVVPVAGAALVAVAVDVIGIQGEAVLPGYDFTVRGTGDRILATVTVKPVPFLASGHIRTYADSKYAVWQGVAYLDNPVAINAGERLRLRVPFSSGAIQAPATLAISLPHAA